MAEPTRTITISVPPDLARDIDRQAEAEGRSRSELYREAARTGATEEEVLEAVVEGRRERRGPRQP